MHIYFYYRGFPAKDEPIHQGLSKAVAGLAAGLVANGAKVTVLTEQRSNSEFMTKKGYRVLCFERTDADDTKNQLKLFLAPGLLDYLRQNKSEVDVVVINGMFHRPLTQMGSALRKLSIPYIVAPHDPFHPNLFKSSRLKKLAYWYLFEQRMLVGARAIQVLDERHALWLRRRGVQRPIIATPNGFDTENISDLENFPWSQTDEVNLIFLGRVDVYNKGLDLLLEALAELDSIHLTIQGPNQGGVANLRAMAESLGLGSRVQIKDPDYSKSSTQIIGEHDIFCLPSRYEGFGLAALEAMLTGRVILVSDIAGVAPHVKVSGCGIVVEPTPASIRTGLEQLLARKSEWRQMGLKGRDYVLKHLHWNELAAKALAEYEKVLS